MNPNSNYSSTHTRSLLLIAVALVCIVAAFIVYKIIFGLGFHVTGTNPGTSSVATVSPFFKINFTQPIDAKSVSLNSSYSVANSFKAEGKTLDISLAIPMAAGRTYTITIAHISDKTGHTMINKSFSFTPSNIAIQNLPADQKSVLLHNQTNKSAETTGNIDFIGVDSLVSYGLSSEEASNLENNFYLFKPSAKSIRIDQHSVQPVPHDRNSASTTDTMYFNVYVDGVPFKARVDYFNLSEARLYLSDFKTGAQVFDSANAGFEEQ